MTPKEKAEIEHRLVHRLVFFTDAVFAIVMTLLALELRLPAGDAPIAEKLGELAPELLAFAMSFGLAGIFWVAHMVTLRRLAAFDWPTAVLNLVFLFTITLMPFASSVFGQAPAGADAWRLYCAVLIAASTAMVALLLVVTRDGGRLMGGVGPRERAYRVLRAAAPGLAFAVGLIAVALGRVGWAHFCWVLIPPISWVAGRALKPAAAARPAPPAGRRPRSA